MKIDDKVSEKKVRVEVDFSLIMVGTEFHMFHVSYHKRKYATHINRNLRRTLIKNTKFKHDQFIYHKEAIQKFTNELWYR